MEGKIIRIISNLYTVKVNNQEYECRARGKFRNEKITPLVGDNCLIDADNNYILEIKKRTNFLTRPAVANVDYAVIVTSLKEPDLSLNLLDKMISIITLNKIKPIICFTKLDLANKKELKEVKKLTKYYQKLGLIVLNNQKINKLKKILQNQVTVFTGQTGAGKSSLLNKMDKNLNLKTGEISQALGRGRHTTRHVELFSVGKCFIVDTPGFSALDFQDFTDEEIRNSFKEFANFPCEFKDCKHLKEQNCQVKKAVDQNLILKSRYENYKSFLSRKD